MEIQDFVTKFYNVMLVAQKKNFLIFLYENKIKQKIIFNTIPLFIPFGLENYNNKTIINLEFKDFTVNNDIRNFLLYMNQIDTYFRTMSNIKNLDNVENIYDYRLINKNYISDLTNMFYTPSIKARTIPQLRLHLTKNTEFFKIDDKSNKILLTSSNLDILKKKCICSIELNNVWTKGSDYGLVWYLLTCQILD